VQSKKSIKSKDIFHMGFEIGLILKGINGLLEIVGGLLLLFLNPNRMDRLIVFMTQNELSKDPNDMVANTLISLGHSFSINPNYFGIYYLMTHGLIKCILIFLLWQKKIWAYSLAMIVLAIFITYQLYRYTMSPSAFLIALSVFDSIMIVLIFIEYRKIKKHQ